MTPRELMLHTLEFRNDTGKVPMDLWTLRWADIHQSETLKKIRRNFSFDMVTCPVGRMIPSPTQGDAYEQGVFIDEWNARFENIQPGVIGEVKYPTIDGEDFTDTSKVRFPEEVMHVDRDAVNRFCAQDERFVMGGCCPRPFERLQFLRGSQQLFVDLILEAPGLEAFIRKVHQFYLREMEIWAKTDVDGLMYMDDWGAQNSLLISPALWRQYFKPCYRDYIDLAHAYGKKIFMHSDGNILEIIPDLVEMKLDAVNSQIFCMGLEKLAPFAGKITFWGEIDRQHLLPHGTTQDIAQAVERVRELLWRNGGCIAQCEFGPGAKGENIYQVFSSWSAYQSGRINP